MNFLPVQLEDLGLGDNRMMADLPQAQEKKKPVAVMGKPRQLAVQPGSVQDLGDAQAFLAGRGASQGAAPAAGPDAVLSGFGAGNPGMGTPESMAGQGSTADEALWRTLTAGRQLPTVHKDMNNLPGGTYSSVPGGYARMGDVQSLAGSSDPAQVMRAMRDFQDTNLVRYTGVGPQALSPQQARAMMAQDFSAGMKGAAENFEKDTQRGMAGVQEYGQKVRGPEQDRAQLEQERLRGETQRDVAQIGKEGMILSPIAAAAARAATDPTLTPGQQTAVTARLGTMQAQLQESKRNAQGGGVRVEGSMKPIRVEGPSQPGTAADARKTSEADLATANKVADLGRLLGIDPPLPGGQQGQTGQAAQQQAEFSANRLAQFLANNPDLTEGAGLDQVAQLLKRGSGGKTPEQGLDEIVKGYIRRGHETSNPNLGGMKMSVDPGILSSTYKLMGPEGQTLRSYDAGPLNSSFKDFFGTKQGGDTHQRYQSEGAALGKLLMKMHGGGMLNPAR